MRGPFVGSMALHVLALLIMIFGSRLGSDKQLPLPTATTVKLVRPKSFATAPKPEENPGQKEPEKKPEKEQEEAVPDPVEPLKIPKETKEPKESKPMPKLEESKPKPRSVLPKLEREGKSGTLRLQNEGFEYDFYLAAVQAKIEQFYRAPSGIKGQLLATMGFRIRKDGTITDIQLLKPSGNLLLDNAAERAIRSAAKFAPLPPQYEQESLAINYEFVVNPMGR